MQRLNTDRRFHRSDTGGAQIAEFAPALLLFITLLFPFINLIGYASAVTTCELIARQSAQAAGTSATFTAALSTMQKTASSLVSSGWGQFAKLTAIGGYQNCGCDLYVTVTPIGGGSSTKFGPNKPYTGAVDQTAQSQNIYEYTAAIHYTISPFVNLSSLPFIGGVPIIGKPAPFNIEWSTAAEFPDGLTQ